MASDFSDQLCLWPGQSWDVSRRSNSWFYCHFLHGTLSFNVQFSTNTAQSEGPCLSLLSPGREKQIFSSNRSQKIFLLILLKDFHSRVLNQQGCWANNAREISDLTEELLRLSVKSDWPAMLMAMFIL